VTEGPGGIFVPELQAKFLMTTEVLTVGDAPFVALDLEDTVFEAGFMA
jgi:hypothetical protein